MAIEITKELFLGSIEQQLEVAYTCCLETDTLLTLLERAHDLEGNGIEASGCDIALRQVKRAQEIIQDCQAELRQTGGAS